MQGLPVPPHPAGKNPRCLPSNKTISTPIAGVFKLNMPASSKSTATPLAPSFAPNKGSFLFNGSKSLSERGRVSQCAPNNALLGFDRLKDAIIFVSWYSLFVALSTKEKDCNISVSANEPNWAARYSRVFLCPAEPGFLGPKLVCSTK